MRERWSLPPCFCSLNFSPSPHHAQDRMHLDCVFSIISDNCCIMLEDIMGAASPKRRLVDEYARDPLTGKYKLAR